mmetsp:Transcript_15331/g.33140  ORF Transcript_15331/g.33140 Transcript_15331/m.33140 type:complete len:89 (-) Transcript_15331:589-855(-)
MVDSAEATNRCQAQVSDQEAAPAAKKKDCPRPLPSVHQSQLSVQVVVWNHRCVKDDGAQTALHPPPGYCELRQFLGRPTGDRVQSLRE